MYNIDEIWEAVSFFGYYPVLYIALLSIVGFYNDPAPNWVPIVLAGFILGVIHVSVRLARHGD